MRLKVSAVSSSSALRLIGIALLAGTAAGCSSDVSRFMYDGTDSLTTASVPGSAVPAPASDRLRPVGEIPNVATAPGQYPQAAPETVSQAFPGDTRQPAIVPGDAPYTGSVPGAAARQSASSSAILSQPQSVARTQLPSAQQSAARVPAAQAAGPVTQAFPQAPQERAPQQQTARLADPATIDPITTGTSGNAGWTSNGGSRVTVGSGDTLYGIARRYNVPVEELMKANSITNVNHLEIGQKLVIPAFSYSGAQPAKVAADTKAPGNGVPVPGQAPQREVAVLPSVPTQRTPQSAQAQEGDVKTASTAKPSAGNGIYVVEGGDTLTRIAKKHGVGVDALKSANNMSGTALRIGQKLRIPGAAASAPDPTTTASVKPADKPRAYTAPDPAPAKDSLAETAKAEVNAAAPASTGIDKLRWPARGQVITGYAQKMDDGKRNDGIDISMPVGSPVKAAENGVVIYSGDGLKEYGNTVLIRHDNGLVTVYANADQLNVKRGDKVSRGQTIASSGMSGNAKTPRLHFEVRKNATPVDPATYLE